MFYRSSLEQSIIHESTLIIVVVVNFRGWFGTHLEQDGWYLYIFLLTQKVELNPLF